MSCEGRLRSLPGAELVLSFVNTRRRTAALLGVILLLLLWQLRAPASATLSGRFSTPVNQASLADAPDPCLSKRLQKLKQLASVPLARIQHSSETAWPAVVGSGALTADVNKGNVRIAAAGGSAAAGDLRWFTRVQPRGHGAPPDVVLVALSSGSIKRLTRLGSNPNDPSCHVLEETLFAHREHPNVLVQHMQVDNSHHEKTFMTLLEPIGQELTTSYVKIKLDPKTPTTAWLKPSTSSTSVLVVASEAPTNITAPAHRVSQRVTATMFILVDWVPTEGDVATGIALDAMPEVVSKALQSAVAKIKSLVAAPDTLIKSHELAYSSLWPVTFDFTGPSLLTSAIMTTFHVLVSSLPQTAEAPMMPAEPSLRRRLLGMSIKGEIGQDTHVGCYSGKPERTMTVWSPPENFAQLPRFVDDWLQRLRSEGCFQEAKSASDVGMASLIQALVFALGGIRVVGHNLRVAPSWDLSPNALFHLRHIPFVGHRLDIRLTAKQATFSRTDSLSEVIFVSGPEGHPTAMKPGGEYQHDANVVYVSTDFDSLVEHRNQDPQQHEKPGGNRSWPVWMIVLLVCFVLAFHILLGRLLYVEYCSKL